MVVEQSVSDSNGSWSRSRRARRIGKNEITGDISLPTFETEATMQNALGWMSENHLMGNDEFMDEPVPPISRQTVAMVKLAPQERVRQRTEEQVADVPLVTQQQKPMVQKVQKHDRDPKGAVHGQTC